jgi:hypothetical protein
MSTSGQGEPKHQTFHGPASFGGDNKGIINNVLLDPRTRATLEKLSKDAPELAGIMRKAIRDGVISPDAVEELQSAVQHINMDVADALLIAGQNINQNVAQDLVYAGENLNGEVAKKFTVLNQELGERVRELNDATESLRGMAGEVISTDTGTVSRAAGVVALPSPRSPGKWWFRPRLICCCFGAGISAGAILMYYHLVTYVILAGILAFMALVIPWIANARRENGFPSPD